MADIEEQESFEDETDTTEESEAPSDEAEQSENSEARINALMSKWQKAEAAKAKAEAELARLKGADKGDDGKNRSSQVDESEKEFRALLAENARKILYESEPRLRQYEIGVDAIEGDTPAEMRASLVRQTKIIDLLESKITDNVLAEHGLAAEIGGGGQVPSVKEIADMSTEEFNAMFDKALNR